MSKKIKTILTLFLLTFFVVTSLNITTASGSAYYSLSSTKSLSKVVNFSPYKAVITANSLNIRKSPSNSGAIVGSYKSGTVVDIIGQFGSFLKTSKGYIQSSYTKKYTTTGNSGGTSGFQTYKVVITTAKLNIRTGPGTSYAVSGYYTSGSIVDVIGVSGSFLKTSKGYIASEYTKKYTEPSNPSRGDSDPVVYTGYIQVTEDTPLLMDVDGASDERYAVAGKTYGVVGQANGYYKVKIGKVFGYIPSSKAVVVTTTPKNKISLAWQYVYSKSTNATYYNSSDDYIKRSSADLGLDVVSPTWFYMSGDASSPSTINAEEKADREYVRVAHRNGYEVWALFQEFNKDRAYKTFYDAAVKNRVINQIVSFALQYNVDGVNIDFEGLGGISANKDGFTAFVRDLSAQLKAVGLNVSVDVVKPTVGSVYSSFTDRPALASYVDYLVYMAYDEHYAGASKAGSVGSFPWVEAGLKDIIAQGVSKDKILLGVPFYLRDFTVQNSYQPYDTVILSVDGRIYKKPFDYNNKMIDINPGYTYKYLETVNDWYKVELEGDTAYIPKNASIYAGANTDLKTVDSSLDIVFPYDTVGVKAQTNVYMQPSQASGTIGSINSGYIYKCLEAANGFYKINYNGTEGYIIQESGIFIPKFSSIKELGILNSIMVPNETIIIKNATGLYKAPSVSESEKLADVKVGQSFKYIGTSPEMSDWYIVDYNGTQGYVHKSYASYIKANTTTNSSVVKSSAVSLQGTLDKVKKYGGSTYYDATAKQNVAQYYADGYWHIVWLEDTHSMGWRMDLVNNYGLAGAAGWDLNWNPSGDIYYVIKSKIK